MPDLFPEQGSNQRRRCLILLGLSLILLAAITIFGLLLEPQALLTDLSQKHLSPSLSHLFGTDALGRDMLARSLAGLSRSIQVGLLTATASALLSLGLGVLSALGGRLISQSIGFLTDLVLGIPHILLLLLISMPAARAFGA